MEENPEANRATQVERLLRPHRTDPLASSQPAPSHPTDPAALAATYLAAWQDLATANWTPVRDGKIAAIRVAFDPRPVLSAMARPEEGQ